MLKILKKLTIGLILVSSLTCESYGTETDDEGLDDESHAKIIHVLNMVKIYQEHIEREIPFELTKMRQDAVCDGMLSYRGIDTESRRILDTKYTMIKAYQDGLFFELLTKGQLDISDINSIASITIVPRYTWEAHELVDTTRVSIVTSPTPETFQETMHRLAAVARARDASIIVKRK